MFVFLFINQGAAFMFRNKVVKLTSSTALLANIPGMALLAQDKANLGLHTVGKGSQIKELDLPQKEVANTGKGNSSLPKFIWYAFLTVAGLYFFGLFEKAVVYSAINVELETSKDLREYQDDLRKKEELEENLKTKESDIIFVQQGKAARQKKKRALEEEVEKLKNDPKLETLKKHIDFIKSAKKEKQFMKILKLREKVSEFWELIRAWTRQNGFKFNYKKIEDLRSNFEQLKWVDECLLKVKDPLSYPEEMLGIELEGLKGELSLFYSGKVEKGPLKFYFSSFKGKDIRQLSEEDFNGAQKEIDDVKKTHEDDYSSNQEFKRECDDYLKKINKFKRNFENFKKAQEKLKEIKKLKKSCSEDLFSDEVEEKIKEIVEAVEKIEAKGLAVPLKFDIVSFKFGLNKGKEFFRYVFKEKDFDEVELVCQKKDIVDKERFIEGLKEQIEKGGFKEEKLRKETVEIKKRIEQLDEKFRSKNTERKRFNHLKDKKKKIEYNLLKFTVPGKYIFFC